MVNFNKFVAIFVVIFTQNTTGDFHQIYQQSESIFISESYFQNTIQNDSDKQGGENAQRVGLCRESETSWTSSEGMAACQSWHGEEGMIGWGEWVG